MDDRAKGYCHAAWYKAGSPSGVDIDDLSQEYLLAELQGIDAASRVAEYLCECVKQSAITENGQKMHFVVATDDRDEGESDEEYNEYLVIEREIFTEHQAERIDLLHTYIGKLARTHPEHARALMILARLRNDELPDVEIALRMNVSERQAKYLRFDGMEQLYRLVHPEVVELPLFGETDEKPVISHPYQPRAKRVEWMTDVILGSV